MDFLRYVDFFNVKFSFYTNNQLNNQSLFGGIMTTLYLIICIIIFILFSIDDLKQLNPITTKSEISYSKTKLVNMTKEKIYIPFRMVNYENQFIDHRGILYIVPYLIEGRYNESIGMDLKYTLLKYRLCNETAMAKKPYNYLISVPLDQLFCIERDDILFGGNWNNDFLNYLEINLYLCEDGVSFNSSDPRCSNINNYSKTLNSSLLFDFHFPMVQFQPTNLKTPIEIIYRNYYYRLSSYSYKIEKLYIKENILSDDINILRTHYKNKSCWGMSTIYSDDYFLPSEYDAISNNSNTSRIYALNIYMDDGLVYYTRTYKKIFLIISNVFPIFRFILYFFKKLTQNIKKSLTKINLINIIFEKKKSKPKKFLKKFEDLSPNQRNNKLIILANKSENELIRHKSMINNEYNFSFKEMMNRRNSTIIYNKNNNEKKLSNRLVRVLDNKSNKFGQTFSENVKLAENSGKYRINKTYKSKLIFPFHYYFLDIIFDNIINPKRFFCMSKAYFIVYNYMCKVYDISTYITLFKHFIIINNMFKENAFEGKEYYYSKIIKKINISDFKLIEKINKDLKDKKSIFYSHYF